MRIRLKSFPLLFLVCSAALAQTKSARIETISEPPELTGEPKKVQPASDTDREVFELLKHLNEKEASSALPRLDEFLRQHPDYSDGYFLRATTTACLLNKQDLDSISNDVNKAMSLPSQIYHQSDYFPMLGKVALAKHDYQLALDDLEKAMRSDISSANRIFNVQGTKPEKTSPKFCIWSLSDLDLLAAKSPTDYRPHVFKGLYYEFFTTFDESNYQISTLEFQRAAVLNPKSPLPQFFLGEIYTKSSFWRKKSWASDKDRDEFIRQSVQPYTKAIQLDSKFVPAYLSRAGAYLNLKQYSLAIKDFDMVLELDPENSSAYSDRGISKLEAGQYSSALSDLRDAIRKKSPEDVFLSELYSDCGEAHMKMDQYDDAVADYSKAIERKLANDTFLMNVKQFRSLYPEYDGVSDEAVIRKVNMLFWPQFEYAEFAKQFTERDSQPSFLLIELYEKRGDAYLAGNDFKHGVADFKRIFRGFPKYESSTDRWRSLGKTSDKEEMFIDTKSAEFSPSSPVRLWLRFNDKKQSQKTLFEIDCKTRRLNQSSVVVYDPEGKVKSSSEAESGWQKIIPDTIGERIYNGSCGKN